MHLPLGYMDDGKFVLWIRPGVWDPEKLPLADAYYFIFKLIFMLCNDPRMLIGGTLILMDFTNATTKQAIVDPNDIKSMVRFGQVSNIKHGEIAFLKCES